MKKYTRPAVNYSKTRKSVTVPDQSLSLKAIMDRARRGVPVDVVQRKGVYLDQEDDDFEKLSRMDFGEKAEYAQQLASEAEAKKAEMAEREAERKEAEQQAQEAKEAKASERKKSQKGSDSDPA